MGFIDESRHVRDDRGNEEVALCAFLHVNSVRTARGSCQGVCCFLIRIRHEDSLGSPGPV